MGKQWKQWLTLFFWAPISLQIMITAIKLKNTPWKESYDQSRQHIKKRWQEYTEELYKKDLHDPDNHDGVITHLEPDIWNVKSSGC